MILTAPSERPFHPGHEYAWREWNASSGRAVMSVSAERRSNGGGPQYFLTVLLSDVRYKKFHGKMLSRLRTGRTDGISRGTGKRRSE